MTVSVGDRCDQCGARAFVFAQFASGPLSFCGHHGTEHWDAINKQATVVIDLRHTILEEPDADH